MTTLLELKVHYVNTWRNNVKSMHQLGLESVHKCFENLQQMHNHHHNHTKDASKKETSW
jgi:hypothetical protein